MHPFHLEILTNIRYLCSSHGSEEASIAEDLNTKGNYREYSSKQKPLFVNNAPIHTVSEVSDLVTKRGYRFV